MATEYDPLEEAKRKEAERKAKKAADDKAREQRSTTSGRDPETQQQELSLTFVRLEQTQAKEQYDLAAEKYAASGSAKDKKAYDEAKLRYNQASAALRSAGVEVDSATGKQGSTPVKYSDRPSNPVGKGFDPYTNVGAAGADNPAERAKSAATGLAPDYVSINTLDNSRWKTDGFLPLSDDPYSFYYASGTSQTELPVAFIANENGSILQDGNGNPIDLGTSVNKIINDYSSSGRMNELRDLLIRSKIAATPAEVAAMTNAKNAQNSASFGQDPNTRLLVQRAVQFLTMSNIAASGVKNNKPKFESFEQYLNGYKGDLNYLLGQGGNGNGSGAPRRTVSLSQRTYTPEDLELNIDAFFQEFTGQGASQEDVDYLVKRLNAQDPQKTVTTTSGNTTRSVTTGGVSDMEERNMMREMALNDPAAESYNKATTYLDYFRKALASPIDLGA